MILELKRKPQVGAEHWCNSCNPPFLLLSGRCVQGCPPEGYYEVSKFPSLAFYMVLLHALFGLYVIVKTLAHIFFCMKARFRGLVSVF